MNKIEAEQLEVDQGNVGGTLTECIWQVETKTGFAISVI